MSHQEMLVFLNVIIVLGALKITIQILQAIYINILMWITFMTIMWTFFILLWRESTFYKKIPCTLCSTNNRKRYIKYIFDWNHNLIFCKNATQLKTRKIMSTITMKQITDDNFKKKPWALKCKFIPYNNSFTISLFTPSNTA